MFSPKRLVWLLLLVLGFYLVLVVDRGLVLVRDGRPAFVLLGLGVLLLPVVGGSLIWREVQFGHATERLGRALDAEGGLPPGAESSGPAEADRVFEARRVETEQHPDDWRAWFRLALAYADAQDLPRARRAMRRAIALEASTRR